MNSNKIPENYRKKEEKGEKIGKRPIDFLVIKEYSVFQSNFYYSKRKSVRVEESQLKQIQENLENISH